MKLIMSKLALSVQVEVHSIMPTAQRHRGTVVSEGRWQCPIILGPVRDVNSALAL